MKRVTRQKNVVPAARLVEKLNKKIESLERTISILKEKNEKELSAGECWNSFIKNTPLILARVDRKGIINDINHVGKGLKKEQVIGKSAFDLVAKNSKAAFKKSFAEVVSSGRSQTIEVSGGEMVRGTTWYIFHIIPLAGAKASPNFILLISDISDIKIAEQTLIQSEERFRFLSDLSTEGIVISRGGIIIEANKIASDMFGVDERIVKGLDVMSFFPHERETFSKRVKQKRSQAYETKVFRADGKTMWVEIVGKNIFYLGQPARVSVFRNITARKESEQKLKESEEKFRLLSEATFEGIIIHSNGLIQQVNDACCKMFGFKETELLGRPVLELATPETRALVKQNIEARSEDPYEAKGLRKDGTIFFGEIRAKEIAFKGGTIRIATVRDITKRKQTESILKGNEQTLSLILNNIDELVYYVEFEKNGFSKVKYISNQIDYVMGLSRKEYMKGPSRLLKNCHPDDIAGIKKAYEKIKKEKLPCSFVYRFMHGGKNKYVWIEERIIPQLDAKGDHIANFGVMRDITEQKEYGAQIEQSRENYRNLIEYSPDGIFIHDENGEVLYANPNMLEIMGIKKLEELPDLNVMSYLPKEYHNMVKIRRQKMIRGKTVPFTDTRIRRPDGVSVEIESKPITVNYNGKPATLVVCHNVSVQRMLEREKLRAHLAEETSDKIRQSLKEKEVLLKEVHHRVKNNLQVISSILNLQSSYVKDVNTLNILKESQNRIKSMAFIHESLYQNKDLASINFSEYVSNLAQNLLHSFSMSDRETALKLDLEEVRLNLDLAIPTGLIINELVSNSLKYAFPGKGKGTIVIRLKLESGIINLSVDDNGTGLPPEIDFRNTESLGLQLVTTLVEQLEGTISLNNVKGAHFLITFNSQKIK